MLWKEYKHIIPQEALKKVLEEYIKTSELIIDDENFIGSPLNILERIIIDPENTLKEHFECPDLDRMI